MTCKVAQVKKCKIIIISSSFSLVSRNEDSEVILLMSMILAFIYVC